MCAQKLIIHLPNPLRLCFYMDLIVCLYMGYIFVGCFVAARPRGAVGLSLAVELPDHARLIIEWVWVDKASAHLIMERV